MECSSQGFIWHIGLIESVKTTSIQNESTEELGRK